MITESWYIALYSLQVQDYTGSYLVRLVPCVAPSGTAYAAGTEAACQIRQPLTFQLDIELQQVSDPVAEVFSLNSELTLTRSKRAWLSNNKTGEVSLIGSTELNICLYMYLDLLRSSLLIPHTIGKL